MTAIIDQKDEIKYAPIRSRVTLDLRPEVFKESDAFSEMMKRAHQTAVRLNLKYKTQTTFKKGHHMTAMKLSEKEIKMRDLQEKRRLYRALGLTCRGKLKQTPAEKRVKTICTISKLKYLPR